MAEYVDPYRAYNFKLALPDGTEGRFTACEGLGVRVDVLHYREGGNNEIVHCMPGPVRYGEVTLRYGLTNSRDLWDWVMAAVAGRVERKNVSVLMLDYEGAQEVMRWDLINSWACEWQGVPLDALGREVAIETLKLVFESIERT
jgi:phage tail-like protein